MKATLEPVAWVLRVFADEKAAADRITYTASASVTVDDAGVATVRGLVVQGGMTVEVYRAIMDALRAHGVTSFMQTRRLGGVSRVNVIPVRNATRTT